ncbi:MAG: TerB family tellurite resistance protein [Sinomicrobium sp.]|nr:TerB family tellurite resistance protein [Sinomicrobium sp.]
MSISDLYSGSFRERNRGHFAAIVRVALSDGEISVEEKAFLERLAKNLEVSQEELKKIVKDPSQYPINPPVSYEDRLERLYDIARMVHADLITDAHEMSMMSRLGIGLGFPVADVDAVVKKAMSLLRTGVDMDAFKEAMRKK